MNNLAPMKNCIGGGGGGGGGGLQGNLNWIRGVISVVTTLAPSFLNGSSSFLQVTRTPIKV